VIDVPGIYTITAEEYLQDPCVEPSLSSSVARTLLEMSPGHARWAHPKLSPAYEAEEADRFDLGRAVHAYMLEGSSEGSGRFEIVDAKDWKTKAAKLARDLARLDGRIPILKHQWERVQAMRTAARAQLERFADRPRPLIDGQPEQTLVWQEEGGIWCRARPDWLHADLETIDDLKSTGASANPDAWTKGILFTVGFDLQAAWYLRGLQVLEGIVATFRYVVQETFPPYALSVIGLGPDALLLAEKKRIVAVNIWRECLRTNTWPVYPTRTCYADLPPWREADWLAREVREEDAVRPRFQQTNFVDDGRDVGDQLAGLGGLGERDEEDA